MLRQLELEIWNLNKTISMIWTRWYFTFWLRSIQLVDPIPLTLFPASNFNSRSQKYSAWKKLYVSLYKIPPVPWIFSVSFVKKNTIEGKIQNVSSLNYKNTRVGIFLIFYVISYLQDDPVLCTLHSCIGLCENANRVGVVIDFALKMLILLAYDEENGVVGSSSRNSFFKLNTKLIIN